MSTSKSSSKSPCCPPRTFPVRVTYGENNVNIGPLKEIPEISVDYFYGKKALKASAFFLTHTHTDHMVGLEGEDFLRRLDEPDVFLYTQNLNGPLLLTFDRYLGGPDNVRDLLVKKKIVPLDTLKPVTLKLKKIDGGGYRTVTVTLLPAGHCPGSVMYLFEEGESLRILHTGDYRQQAKDLLTLKCLYEHENHSLKRIDHLYVDTTFCKPDYGNVFPDRREVLRNAMEQIGGWIRADPCNWVFIKLAAKFSHEYILKELYTRFGIKVHVAEYRYNAYRDGCPALAKVLESCTLERDTAFHFCGDAKCLADEGKDCLVLKLTSAWFTMQPQPEPGRRGRGRGRGRGSSNSALASAMERALVRRGNSLTVCYSMHASMQEVVDLIDNLKPMVVTPLVVPFGAKVTLLDVKKALTDHCTHSFWYDDYQTPRERIAQAPLPFGSRQFQATANSQSTPAFTGILQNSGCNIDNLNCEEKDLVDEEKEHANPDIDQYDKKYQCNFAIDLSPERDPNPATPPLSKRNQPIWKKPILCDSPSSPSSSSTATTPPNSQGSIVSSSSQSSSGWSPSPMAKRRKDTDNDNDASDSSLFSFSPPKSKSMPSHSNSDVCKALFRSSQDTNDVIVEEEEEKDKTLTAESTPKSNIVNKEMVFTVDDTDSETGTDFDDN